MSLTTNLVLLDRTKLEGTIATMINDVLSGSRAPVIQVLRSHLSFVAKNLDTAPDVFFQQKVGLGIETLEGRFKEAFVNDLTPVITEPKRAWDYNVRTHVRGALALSLCAKRPGPDLSPALIFWGPFSWIIRHSSPTAALISDSDDPTLLESTCIGIFQEPEMFLRRTCIERILIELEPLMKKLSVCSENEETIRSLQHYYALISAPLNDPKLAVLKGYL